MAAGARRYAGVLAGTVATGLVWASPAGAASEDEDRLARQAALGYAGMVQAAYRRVEQHVRDESSSATADFPGGIPPAATGWHGSWTDGGLRARYCGETLLVYVEPAQLKGTDQRSVQAAPFRYAGVADATPVLHWLEVGIAEGGEGRETVTLPACMTGLPSGRAALAGGVPDPFLNLRDRVSREQQVVACAAGQHGAGRTMVREATQRVNGRDDPVGALTYGPWSVLIDDCRADYQAWEYYTVACNWYEGAPHNKFMTGTQIWRRERTVTGIDSAGQEIASYGTPQFVSTSCWNDPNPPLPTATITVSSNYQYDSDPCPPGYIGSRDYRRTVTRRSALFPWDNQPTVTQTTGGWVLVSNSCRLPPPPPPPPNPPVAQNPGQNPGQTPAQTPGQAPGQSPGQQTPGQTPGQNPGQNPGHTPGQNPGQQPQTQNTGGGNNNDGMNGPDPIGPETGDPSPPSDPGQQGCEGGCDGNLAGFGQPGCDEPPGGESGDGGNSGGDFGGFEGDPGGGAGTGEW